MFQHIIHLADIHIGSSNYRSTEYRNVFDNLKSEINKIIIDEKVTFNNVLIIIAGDIFHHKTRYSGEDIADFNYLMNVLKDFQIIIIPGNHDANLYDTARTDLITPLIANNVSSNNEHVHYYKHSGKYTLNNLSFYHISVFGNETSAEIESLIDNDLNKDTILLYHGLITGARLDKHTVNDQRITARVLNAVKCTIAGDIHQHHFILPTCAYSGSLIQQNVAEGVNKGFLHWNLTLMATKFIPVINNCGFIRLDLRGKTRDEATAVINNLPQLDKIHKVRLLTDATGADYDAQTRAITSAVGRLDSIAVTELNNMNTIVNPTEDIRAALDELLTTANATADVKAEIINDHCSKLQPFSSVKWTVLELSWGNMFKYGTGNIINFSALTDISGVIANNMAGKSSIIDILVYVLYGEHLRAENNRSMIRNGVDNCYIKCKFQVSADTYIIQRTDSRSRHTKVRLYKIETKDGVAANTNITAETIDATYRIIKGLIGSLDVFQTTGLYYDPNLDIVKMKNSVRMQILPELFGMTDSESILAEIKTKIKHVKQQIAALVKPRAAVCPTIARDNLLIQLAAAKQSVVDKTREQEQIKAEIESSRDYLRKSRDPTIVRRELDQLETELKQIQITIANSKCKEVPQCIKSTAPTENVIKLSLMSCSIDEETCTRQIIQFENIEKPPVNNINKEALIQSLHQYEQELMIINASINNIVETNKNSPNDSNKINAQLNVVRDKITECKLLPIDNKHLEALMQQRNKLSTDAGLAFNETCNCCDDNKKHLAHDLVEIEKQITIVRQQNETINTTNTQTNEKLTKLHLLLSRLQNDLSISIEYTRLSARKSALENLITITQLDLSKYAEHLDWITKYNDAQKNIPILKGIRDQVRATLDAQKQITAYNNWLAYDAWTKYTFLLNKQEVLTDKISIYNEELLTADDYITATKDIARLTKQLEIVTSELNTAHLTVGMLASKYDTVITEINIYEEYYKQFPILNTELAKYKLYADCLGSKGLRMAIIKRNIDKLLDAVNEILALVCNFKLAHELSDNSVGFNIIEPNNTPPLSLGSGFQKFIISIAMRLALTSILPSSCQFIIIDEGFGCMDATNIEQVAKLFTHIAGKFKFTFIISHREQLQPVITQPLYINETPNGSLIALHEDLNILQEGGLIEDTTIKIIPREDIPEDSYLCKCGIVIKKANRVAHTKTARHIKNVK